MGLFDTVLIKNPQGILEIDDYEVVEWQTKDMGRDMGRVYINDDRQFYRLYKGKSFLIPLVSEEVRLYTAVKDADGVVWFIEYLLYVNEFSKIVMSKRTKNKVIKDWSGENAQTTPQL